MADRYNLEDLPFFEDAHAAQPAVAPAAAPAAAAEPMLPPNAQQRVAPRDYQNVLVYEPTNYNDVQTLIDYLKRKEPAIINLDGVDPATAQRVLDFTSGAIYALNGSVLRISGNIFLLSPEGVGVTIPHDLA